jgi:hypothetical protein
MAEPEMAMEKAELKQLLVRSKKEPVSCAVAQAKEPAFALILLHKVKQPKALSKQLEGDFKDAKNHRWGTAFVDVDDNPKLVVFKLNKPAPGIARKLVKSLKGTGFTKARLQFDDGSAPEEHDDEATEEAAAQPGGAAPAAADAAAAQPAAAPQAAASEAPAAPAAAPAAAEAAPAAPQQAAPAGPDAGELQHTLAGLVKRVAELDQNARAAMAKLANDANTSLKSGDLNGAAGLIGQLKDALNNAAPAGAQPQAAPANGQADPAKAAAATFTKSSMAWTATRKKIDGEVAKLSAALQKAYAEDGLADEVVKQFKQRLDPVLAKFDSGLAQTLDAASNATDAQQRAQLVAQAKQQISSYQQAIGQEPLFKQLDSNPFVPIAVLPTLQATLTALAAAVK